MLSKSEQQAVLNKILSDPLFAKSETYQKLLTYLVSCSQKNKIPSEIDIAVEVLNKDHTFDPSEDTLVRVYVYKLRHKLESYYSQGGHKDAIKLEIPKGRYNVTFQSNLEKVINKRRSVNLLTIFTILTLVVVVSVFFNVYQFETQKKFQATIFKSDNHIDATDILWSDFLNNELPTQITFGNLFAFIEIRPELDSYRLVRDDKISSEDAFNQFIAKYSLNSNNYSLSSWDILPKSSIKNLSYLQPLFISNQKKIEISTTDEIRWEDLKKYNFVYIGHLHNLNILNEILPLSRFTYHVDQTDQIKRRELYVHINDSDSVYTFIEPLTSPQKYVRDYIILSKVPGPQQNVFLYIISFHQIGRMEVVKNLTDYSLLKNLEDSMIEIHGSVPQFFEMLLEVEGYDETALSTTVKHVFEVSPAFQVKK